MTSKHWPYHWVLDDNKHGCLLADLTELEVNVLLQVHLAVQRHLRGSLHSPDLVASFDGEELARWVKQYQLQNLYVYKISLMVLGLNSPQLT